jgi:uncharacterized membrane protein YjdF
LEGPVYEPRLEPIKTALAAGDAALARTLEAELLYAIIEEMFKIWSGHYEGDGYHGTVGDEWETAQYIRRLCVPREP